MKYLLVAFLFLTALPVNAAVVFMYHRFGEARHPSTNVTMEQFAQHLDFLERENFEVWPLPRIVRWLDEGRAVPDKVAAITIDDAYASVHARAFPLLKERGMPFTVFVSTDAVDRGLGDFMSWEQLRELKAAGATIANHSATHDYLVRQKETESDAARLARVRADIERAQRRLQEELGDDINAAPRLFAYPYGEYDQVLADMVKAMGYVAFGQHSGALGRHSDTRALPRYPVNERYAAMNDFALKARSLPLPVLSVSPWDPLVKGRVAPELVLELGESDADLGRLACYFEGKPMQLSREGKTLRVSTDAELPAGRSRYNCTAPHRDGGRWFWFSQPWIVER